MKAIASNRTAGRLLVVCMTALPLAFSACKHEDNTTNTSTVSAEEAGTVMAQAVDPQTGGLVLQTEFGANLALNTNSSFFCGVKKDSTLAGQFTGTDRSFAYSLSWTRQLTCNGTTPVKYEHSFTGTVSYSVPAVTSNGNLSGNFAITGLEPGTGQLNFDQTYTYSGTQQSNVRLKRTLTSNVVIHSSNIKVDKISRQIVSGTATVNINGAASTGETFNYNGTVTFLGGRKATLDVAGGGSFAIQW